VKSGNETDPLLFQIASAPRRRARNCDIDPNGYKVVSVRLREPEFLCFSEQVADAGLTNNQAMRIAARRIAGFLETDEETRALLREISANISGISQNLSRLNRQAANSGTVDMAALASERLAFGQQFVRLEDKLRVVLNVSLRRQDGMTMLKKAARQ
jgi:type IV secretion system T-DNA border endonuclease VirD1